MGANRKRFRWMLLFASVVLAALVGEVAVRIVEAETGQSWAVMTHINPARTAYVPHPFLGYTVRPSHASGPGAQYAASTNSLGFRGHEFCATKSPRTLRIICLGGSTTWGTGATSDQATWPAVLEQQLNASLQAGGAFDKVEIINAGVSGYTIMESFINLKMRILPLDPDLVIIYHGINDAQAIRRGEFKTDYSHVRRSWKESRPSEVTELFAWSHLYGLVSGHGGRSAKMTLSDHVHVEGYDQLEERPLEEVQHGVRNYGRTLEEMISIARLRGVRVALSTFTWADEAVHATAEKEELARVMEALNRTTRSVGRRFKAPVIDLRGKGPRKSAEFDDMVHFNDAGNRKAGRIVARWLLDWRALWMAPAPGPGLAPGSAQGSGPRSTPAASAKSATR